MMLPAQPLVFILEVMLCLNTEHFEVTLFPNNTIVAIVLTVFRYA